MKTLSFKSVSPFFEQERDGIKLFTIRRVDRKDPRFRALVQWYYKRKWWLEITNPDTGEAFGAPITNVAYLARWVEDDEHGAPEIIEDYMIIEFGRPTQEGR